jgi:hypothetical protein
MAPPSQESLGALSSVTVRAISRIRDSNTSGYVSLPPFHGSIEQQDTFLLFSP